MSFRLYAVLMGIGTHLAWTAWIVIVQAINPEEAGFLGLLFFYLTLFLACIGTLSLIGLLYRIGIRKRNEMLFHEVQVTFRHAILFSIVLIISLWLTAQQMLYWYYLLTMFLVVAGVEYLFLALVDRRRG